MKPRTLEDAAYAVLSESKLVPTPLLSKAQLGGFGAGQIERIFEKALEARKNDAELARRDVDRFIDGLAALRLNRKTVAAVASVIMKAGL
jgi:hypothetical protein